MKLGATATKTALLALTGLMLTILPSLSADSVPDPQTGDLFIGFRAAGGLGGSDSYVVNIGSDTQFTLAPAGTSLNVTIPGQIVEDLKSNYGENWNTRADLFWGIFGFRTNNGNPIIYGSRERENPNVVSTAWPTLTPQNRTSTYSQISPVIQGLGGYRGHVATVNSPVAILQANSSNGSSYNKQVATAGTTDFGSVSQWTSVEGDFGGGESATVLDLFRLAPSGVTRVGSFTISSAGVVRFTNVLPTSPNADSDHDGVTDGDEAIAGTDPHDPTDFFRVSSVIWAVDGVQVNFKTAATRNYQIEYSATLAAGSWVPVGSHTSGAAGALHQFLDTDSARRNGPKGFYRVKVSQ